MAKIFVAVRHEPLPLVRKALDGHEVIVVRNLEHGKKLLCDSNFDLYLIDVLFDDSRAVELLREMHRCAKDGQSPLLMVRLMSSVHEEMLRATMKPMQNSGTILEYLEGDIADPDLEIRIRRLVEESLSGQVATRRLA